MKSQITFICRAVFHRDCLYSSLTSVTRSGELVKLHKASVQRECHAMQAINPQVFGSANGCRNGKAITQREREKSDVTRDSGIKLNVAIRLSFFIIVTSFIPFTCDVFCEVHGRHHTHREGHVDRQELAFGLSAGFHLRCSRAAEQLHSAENRQTAQGQ